METLYNGFTLKIAPGTFPLSTDSMVLADFVRLPKQARVLDLGAGCGTLGLMLCAKDPNCHLTGIELDDKAHQWALKNIAANNLQDRMGSLHGDLTDIGSHVRAGSFDVCLSNPPYFTAGFRSNTTPLARHEDSCSLDALFHSAAWALKYGGDFFLVHKPERLAEIMLAACTHKLEPKRLCLVRHKENGPVALTMLQCRKGGKPGLTWEELILCDRNGQPTEDYRRIYHL